MSKPSEFKMFRKCIPKGPYVVTYSIHDAHKGTHFYQELQMMAGSYKEARSVKAPSTGHIISIKMNLRKFYIARPIDEL